MASAASVVYSNSQVLPYIDPKSAVELSVPLAATQNLAAGTVMSEVAGTPGKYIARSAAKLAAPVAGPVLTDAAGAGGWTTTPILGCYTVLTAAGESTPSPAVAFTPVGAKKLHVAIIVVPAGATGINIYAGPAESEPVLIGTSANGAAADYDVPGAGVVAVTPPTSNTTAPARGVLKYPSQVDAAGNITLSATAGQSGGEFGTTDLAAPMYISGTFRTEDLVGLDADSVEQLGARLVMGDTTSGIVRIP